jgi:hypothetical protein
MLPIRMEVKKSKKEVQGRKYQVTQTNRKYEMKLKEGEDPAPSTFSALTFFVDSFIECY